MRFRSRKTQYIWSKLTLEVGCINFSLFLATTNLTALYIEQPKFCFSGRYAVFAIIYIIKFNHFGKFEYICRSCLNSLSRHFVSAYGQLVHVTQVNINHVLYFLPSNILNFLCHDNGINCVAMIMEKLVVEIDFAMHILFISFVHLPNTWHTK